MNKVTLYGTTYKVVLTDKKMGDFDPDIHEGLIVHDEKTIYIDSSAKIEERILTLYHELHHLACKEIGIRQTSLPLDIEEMIITAGERVIKDVFLKPELVKDLVTPIGNGRDHKADKKRKPR